MNKPEIEDKLDFSKTEKNKITKEAIYSEQYYNLSKNKCMLFNYFLENQTFLGWISKKDYVDISALNYSILINKRNSILTGLGLAALFRHVAMPFFLNWKIQRFNIPVTVAMYYLGGVISKSFGEIIFNHSLYEDLQNIQNKYDFGYEDYVKAAQMIENIKMDLTLREGFTPKQELKDIQNRSFNINAEFSKGEDRTDSNDLK